MLLYVAEGFQKTHKSFSIRRKSMLNKFTPISFIDQSCRIETSRMFSYCSIICTQGFYYTLEGYACVCGYSQQDFNSIMVCHSLEMPLHLFRRFWFCHIYIIHNILTNSSL